VTNIVISFVYQGTIKPTVLMRSQTRVLHNKGNVRTVRDLVRMKCCASTESHKKHRPAKVGADSTLRRSIGYTSARSLSHEQNVFSWGFAALSYFNPCSLLRISLFIAALSMTVVSLHALSPDKLISQFTHTVWSAQEGIPVPVRAIAQTPDGYLWLGSEAGLFRFDGLHFLAWEPASGEHLLSDSVLSLYVARDGRLWIGYGSGGIGVLAGGRLQNFIAGHGVPGGEILSIVEDRDGSIWACGPYGFSKYANGVWHSVGMEMGYPAPAAQTLLVDRAGNLWVATDQKDFGLSRDPVRRNTILTLAHGAGRFAATGLGVGMVWSMSVAPDGAVWMADTSGFAARRITGPTHGLAEITAVDRPTRLVFDSEHAVWIGSVTSVQRLTTDFRRRREAPQDRIRRVDGLSGGFVYSTFRDREGNLWFGTSGGLDEFSEKKFVTFSAKEGLEPDQQTAVSSTADGSVWVIAYSLDKVWRLRERRLWTSEIRAPERAGASDILSIFAEGQNDVWLGGNSELAMGRDGKFSRLQIPSVAKGAYIEAVAKDRAGSLWIALRTKQGSEHVMRFRGGLWDELSATGKLPDYRCRVMYGDQMGRMWLGFENGEVAVSEGGAFRLFSTGDGLPAEIVLMITADTKGHIWVGGFGGLSRFENGHFSTITKQNGLPGNSVSGLVEDEDGSFWIAGALGILRASGEELEKALASPSYRMQGTSFDASDGLRGLPQQREPFPTATRAADGWLWFVTTEGIAGINPHEIPRNLVPPPVVIGTVRSDDQDLVVSTGMQLHPNTRNLEFHFTALSYTDPAQVHFRYKLDGYDEGWRGPVSVREARYTNLPPGSYTFRVLACNNDGVWNEAGTFLDFSIAPAWYQSNWFRVSCVVSFLLVLWALYQLRLRQLAHQFNLTLEARVNERTRIARDLHDTLLQSFHGVLFRIQAARNMLPRRPEEAIDALDGVIGKAEQAITEGRDAIQDLRAEAAAEGDLVHSLTALGQELAGSQEANPDSAVFSVTVEGARQTLSPILQDEAYRIAREVLRNAFLHARAHQVEAEIRYDERLFRLRIRDDGKGIDPKVLNAGRRAGHWGLPGIRERAKQIGARLEFWSEAGAGTEVELTVPASVAFETTSNGHGFRLFRKARNHEHRS
jgi:signal transduction histidine kinase/ligand-binding sensor domain-containing protein